MIGIGLLISNAAYPQSSKALPAVVSKPVAIDFSSVDAFWEIQRILSGDKDPSVEQWNILFETSGYALLEEKERRRKSLTQAFRLAYMPSKGKERDQMLEKPQGWLGYVLPHIVRIPKEKERTERFADQRKIRQMLKSAQKKALEFLPTDVVRRFPPPSVSFVYFIDARGYGTILLDPLHVALHDNPVGMLGHELHHYYRNKLPKYKKPFGQDGLAHALNNVAREGTAGLIDKRHVPKMTKSQLRKFYRKESAYKYFDNYQKVYADSNKWLAFFDKSLEAISESTDQKEKLGWRLQKEVPDNARAMGTYMSEIIIKELGKESLIRVIGDSFAFWQVYNVAAKRSNGRAYVLSKKAMSLIANTGNKYL